jgi:hypothetical protein
MFDALERPVQAACRQRHFPGNFVVCRVFKLLIESRGRQAAGRDVIAEYFP